MTRLVLVSLVCVLVATLGCQQEQKPTGGVVAGPSATIPEYAPEVTFVNPKDGKSWKLSQLYGDVTVVAFTTLKGEACAVASKEVLEAAKKLQGEGIPVVEVMWPTGDCKSAACNVVAHSRAQLFTCIEDPEGKARKAFGISGDDMMLIIGRNGKIERAAAPADLAGLVAQATTMQHDKNFNYTEFTY